MCPLTKRTVQYSTVGFCHYLLSSAIWYLQQFEASIRDIRVAFFLFFLLTVIVLFPVLFSLLLRLISCHSLLYAFCLVSVFFLYLCCFVGSVFV